MYPQNYDAKKSYPVLLGLSGGNQSSAIVDFCYAAWFKSDYFKNYLTIMPVNSSSKSMDNYTSDEIQNLLSIVKNNFKTDTGQWVIDAFLAGAN